MPRLDGGSVLSGVFLGFSARVYSSLGRLGVELEVEDARRLVLGVGEWEGEVGSSGRRTVEGTILGGGLSVSELLVRWEGLTLLLLVLRSS